MDELKLKLRKLRRPRKTKEVQQKAGSQDTDHLIGAFHHQRVWTEDTQQRYHPATKGIRSIAQVDRHKSQQYKHQQQVELLPNNSNAALFLRFWYEVLHDTAKFIKLMILVVVVGALCWILLHKSIEVLRNLAILSFFQSSLFSAAKHLLGVGWILR